MKTAGKVISSGSAVLGIELGSTRIKAVLTDAAGKVLAQGNHTWENRFEDGLWTYSLDDIWSGLRDCYGNLRENVQAQYGVPLTRFAAIGVSAMMHGYMPFDAGGELLVPFRTWRNTNTGRAAAELSTLFDFNIPLRWSISHIYQAVLDNEPHVKDIRFFTTLAGYVHWKLTGRKVLGLDDASGMFPVDSRTLAYDSRMLGAFEDRIAPLGLPWKLRDILPEILSAGAAAGSLTEEGAALLDPSGELLPGIPFCPPEGDAGTGMVATNSVQVRTGNVSAGTSSFSMIVLEKPLKKNYPAIDIVCTPDGLPVAMVHCNNCTSELNSWVEVFNEYQSLLGVSQSTEELYSTLFNAALQGDPDCGGLVGYNFVSGEPVMGFESGRPVFITGQDTRLTLANFMRSQLYGAIAVLKAGNDVLFGEDVQVDRLTGHGGYFKTPGVGQRILAAALNSPVTVMQTAGEGGAWGIALLAAFMAFGQGMTLPEWLEEVVFAEGEGTTVVPTAEDVAGFNAYFRNYKAMLPVEAAAVNVR